MPVFVSHNHLLYDILNILVGGFHCAIHLWSIRRRIMVLDLELHAELCGHSVVEIGTIVRDNPFGDSILIDEVMLNNSGHHNLGNIGK